MQVSGADWVNPANISVRRSQPADTAASNKSVTN